MIFGTGNMPARFKHFREKLPGRFSAGLFDYKIRVNWLELLAVVLGPCFRNFENTLWKTMKTYEQVIKRHWQHLSLSWMLFWVIKTILFESSLSMGVRQFHKKKKKKATQQTKIASIFLKYEKIGRVYQETVCYLKLRK